MIAMKDAVIDKRSNSVTCRGKPSIEIYRPPGGRLENTAANLHLNVHAKEFTIKQNEMHNNISNRSSHNDNRSSYYKLQHSKSSGNVHRFMYNQHQGQQINYHHHGVVSKQPHALNTSASSGNILHPMMQNNNRVHFNVAASPDESRNSGKPAKLTKSLSFVSPYGLKRSKSFGINSDSLAYKAKNIMDVAELGKFAGPVQDALIKAMEDPNSLNSRTLMDLVKHILDRVQESRRYAEPAAKVCSKIIQEESEQNFLESLTNMCQQWYQDNSRSIIDTLSCQRFAAFMTFLNEMYCQLKRIEHQQEEGVPPGRVLLTLLWKCCQDSLQPSFINSLSEAKCLFFILTCIGKDLDNELPIQSEQLMACIRDAFLSEYTSNSVRKILLQIIELHAADWQLPASALLYYYSGSIES